MYNNKALLDVISHLKSSSPLPKSEQRKPRFGFNTHGNVIPVPNPGGRNVTLIAAMDSQNGIGKNNQIPWAISPDMQQFKRLTTDHYIVMGKKTFESLNSKPLPNRINIVLSRQPHYLIEEFYRWNNVCAFSSLEDASFAVGASQTFIIGGAQIYKEALDLGLVHDMILTRIQHNAQCDTFFPEFDQTEWLPPIYSTHALSGGVTMRYEYWQRVMPETPPLKE